MYLFFLQYEYSRALSYNVILTIFTAQVPRLNFEPTPEFPALQYFGELEKGGEAELKGVKTGDFIIEVSPCL